MLTLAGAVVVGAGIARPAPVAVAGGATVAALLAHRPVLLVLAAALFASTLGARAEAGLRPPVTGSWSGWVTVLRDPQRTDTGTRLEVRLAGKHVLASASGPPGWRLERAEAGDRVQVRAVVTAIRRPVAPRWPGRTSRSWTSMATDRS